MPAVSIVMRARNEAASLAELFAALASQEPGGAPPWEVEWIVVDHASRDGTAALSRAAGARVVPLPEDGFSYGRALNLGFAAARSPVAVALSAHAVPASCRWLCSLLAPFASAEVAAVFGPEWPRARADCVAARGLRRRYGGLPTHQVSARGPLSFANTNGAVRLDVWRALPFEESLPYAEDLEWSLRALAAGRQIVFQPEAAVYHSHCESPSDAYRRAFAEGRAARRLRRPQRHHGAAGLVLALTAGTALDAATLAACGAAPQEWSRSLRRRWARSVGGWRGYRSLSGP